MGDMMFEWVVSDGARVRCWLQGLYILVSAYLLDFTRCSAVLCVVLE